MELEALSCEFGVLVRADGSARFSHGATSVLAGVYGPAEAKINKERWDRPVLEVVVKPEKGQGGPRERQLEQLLSSCCEAALLASLHPHTAISITLQVERDQGQLLSTLCLACCLAVVDAALPLSSPFTALTCGFSDEGELFPDLSNALEEECRNHLTVVTDCKSGEVITTHALGSFTVEQLQKALCLSAEAAGSLLQFYHQSLQRRLSKDAKFSHLNIAI